MRKRNVPFGYEIKDCKKVVKTNEALIVRKIYDYYINGYSYSKIAENMTMAKIDYTEDNCYWNKNNIKRILEDERYIGEKGYIPIIDEETKLKVKRIIEEKNKGLRKRINEEKIDEVRTKEAEGIKETEKETGIYIKEENNPFYTPIYLKASNLICECNGILKFEIYSKSKSSSLTCSNPLCKNSLKITKRNLKKEIEEMFDMISAIDKVEGKEKTDANINYLENNIAANLNSIIIDKEELINNLKELASERYKEIDKTEGVLRFLKNKYKQKCVAYYEEIYLYLVERIEISNDNIKILLKNGQKLIKQL